MNWWALKRKIHISWLIAVFSVSFSIGVFLAQYMIGCDKSLFLFLLLALLLIVFCMINRMIVVLPILVIGGIVIGLFRGGLTVDGLLGYADLYEKPVIIYGVVSDDVDSDQSGQISLKLGQVVHDGVTLPGQIWVSGYADDVNRGDGLAVSGGLMKGFGNFAAVIYHAKIDVVNRSDDPLLDIRDSFASQVSSYVSWPESSLGIGFLVGMKRDLPFELGQSLKVAGLTHIIVASGYNLTILVRLSRRLFEKISKYMAASVSMALVVVFVMVAGLSPSMVRAGFVTTLSLLAWYYGRKFHPIVLLSFVLLLTLMINPIYAWGDLGWQLSFAAFFGVMIMAPLMQKYLFGDKKAPFIMQVLVETMSAFVATLPILIVAFGQVSNVAIFSNLLVLPFVPLAMLLTFLVGVFGYLMPIVAVIIGQIASWLMCYMVAVAKHLSELEWASGAVVFDWVGVAIFYFVLCVICLYLWRVTGYNLRDSNLVE